MEAVYRRAEVSEENSQSNLTALIDSAGNSISAWATRANTLWSGLFSGVPLAPQWEGVLSAETDFSTTRELSLRQPQDQLLAEGLEWIGPSVYLTLDGNVMRVDVDVRNSWSLDREPISDLVVQLSNAEKIVGKLNLRPSQPLGEIDLEASEISPDQCVIVLTAERHAKSTEV
jgi:hypothetical protein